MRKTRTSDGDWRAWPCRVRGCPHTVTVKRHRLCEAHFSRLSRKGSVLADVPLRPRRSLPVGR